MGRSTMVSMMRCPGNDPTRQHDSERQAERDGHDQAHGGRDQAQSQRVEHGRRPDRSTERTIEHGPNHERDDGHGQEERREKGDAKHERPVPRGCHALGGRNPKRSSTACPEGPASQSRNAWAAAGIGVLPITTPAYVARTFAPSGIGI